MEGIQSFQEGPAVAVSHLCMGSIFLDQAKESVDVTILSSD